MLGTLRERQIKLREDALVLQEQMTEFRNNVVKEVLAIFQRGKVCSKTVIVHDVYQINSPV